MTDARRFNDDEGTFGDWQQTDRECPACHSHLVRVRPWESRDGAYEDSQFQCFALTCAHTWWVDGPDT